MLKLTLDNQVCSHLDIKSSTFAGAEIGKPLQIGRLSVMVINENKEAKTVDAVATINMHTHWTDQFYGADSVRLTLDVSAPIIKIVSASIINGWVGYDVEQKSTFPTFVDYGYGYSNYSSYEKVDDKKLHSISNSESTLTIKDPSYTKSSATRQ